MPPRKTTEPAPEEAPEEEQGHPSFIDLIDIYKDDWKVMPLAAKLAKIGGALGNIPKRGWNPNQQYRFARETDLVSALRPYLAASGILITFSVTNHEILQRQDPNAKGMLTHITLHWTVTDGQDTISGDMPGYGMDSGDKGVYKAITGAKKYVLMTLFLIDTGDDPEAEKEEKRPPQARMAQQVQRAQYANDEAPAPPPVVTPMQRSDVVRGGKTTEATDTQKDRVIDAVRQRGWTARVFLTFIRTTLDSPLAQAPEEDPALLRDFISAVLNSLNPEDMGKLLMAIEAEEEVGY